MSTTTEHLWSTMYHCRNSWEFTSVSEMGIGTPSDPGRCTLGPEREQKWWLLQTLPHRVLSEKTDLSAPLVFSLRPQGSCLASSLDSMSLSHCQHSWLPSQAPSSQSREQMFSVFFHCPSLRAISNRGSRVPRCRWVFMCMGRIAFVASFTKIRTHTSRLPKVIQWMDLGYR